MSIVQLYKSSSMAVQWYRSMFVVWKYRSIVVQKSSIVAEKYFRRILIVICMQIYSSMGVQYRSITVQQYSSIGVWKQQSVLQYDSIVQQYRRILILIAMCLQEYKSIVVQKDSSIVRDFYSMRVVQQYDRRVVQEYSSVREVLV